MRYARKGPTAEAKIPELAMVPEYAAEPRCSSRHRTRPGERAANIHWLALGVHCVDQRPSSAPRRPHCSSRSLLLPPNCAKPPQEIVRRRTQPQVPTYLLGTLSSNPFQNGNGSQTNGFGSRCRSARPETGSTENRRNGRSCSLARIVE